MTDTQDLTHRCPFCGADPGTPCVSRRGGELERIHMRRREVAKPKPPARVRQALCCQCGQLRTCKTWRKGGGYKPGDQWRRRWVGQLKCSHCQAITDHALLIPAEYRDSDERRQRLALGDRPRDEYEQLWDLKRLRREYREVVPQNPNLRHLWWVRDEDAARGAGVRAVPTLCGGAHQLRGDQTLAGAQRIEPQYLAPDPVRTDEYTDLETGESWRDGDCVDCLRVYNAQMLDRRRRDLRALLLRAFVQAKDAQAIERLIAALESCCASRVPRG